MEYGIWRNEYCETRGVFRRIDNAARAAGFDGNGDDLEAGDVKTLDGLLAASKLFLDAKLGRLPEWLHREALNRCRAIVATSSKPAPAAARIRGMAEPLGEGEPEELQPGEPPRPRATAPALSMADCGGLAAALRGGAVR